MPIPRFRLLMIEDNPERAAKIREWIPDGCQLVVSTSAGMAMGVLQRDSGNVYGAVMLDHDLHEQPAAETDLALSGTDLVNNIIIHLSRDVPILVHSMNSSRGPQLVDRLMKAGFDVTRIPFAELDKNTFVMWLEEAREDWLEIIQLN